MALVLLAIIGALAAAVYVSGGRPMEQLQGLLKGRPR